MDEEYKTKMGIRQLIDFVEDCRQLDKELFRKRHGDAFLLHNGPAEALRLTPLAASPTLTATGRVKLKKPGPQWELVVMPVRSSGRAPISGFISVGRTENNDVVVLDYSASKFHAFFKQGDDGQFLVQDAGSRNGTFLNGKRIAARGKGDPTLVESGAQLRFGSVEFTFWRSVDFYELIRKMAGL